MSIGLGPVFAWEWKLAARRWQMYAARSGFVAILLATLMLVWWSGDNDLSSLSIQGQAAAGENFFQTIVATQLALVVLAAPAATAGAVCLDKSRGTLMHVLMTDLTDSEIVLGKLAARLWPALGLVACTLGVMSLSTWLGGIDPMALVGAFLVTIGVAVLGCAMAFLFSVWARTTIEALIATYGVWAVWLLAIPCWYMLGELGVGTRANPPEWFMNLNPFWVIANVQRGAVDLLPHVLYLAACLGLSGLFALVAMFKMRAVAIRQSSQPAQRKNRRGKPVRRFRETWFWRLLPAPSLDRNPVLWREWNRRQPSGWSRTIWGLFTLVWIAASGLVIFACWNGSRNGVEIGVVMVNGGAITFALLLLSVSCASALAEERTRGSLDALMATPMSTASILMGKWLASVRSVVPLVILPALTIIAGILFERPLGPRSPAPDLTPPIQFLMLALICGLILAYGAALASLGLALATWCKRLGRAVGISVSAYAFMTVGWVFFCALTIRGGNAAPAAAMGSPFMGVAYAGDAAVDIVGREAPAVIAWQVFWLVAYTSAAAGLLFAAMATFDRCLGRMSEEPCEPRLAPEKAGKRKVSHAPAHPDLDERAFAEALPG